MSRRRLFRSRSSQTDERFKRLQRRIVKAEERLSRQSERLRRQRQRLDDAADAQRVLKEQLAESRRELAASKRENRRVHGMCEILASQVGAIEERLQDLAERAEAVPYHASDEDMVRARSLVEEIREEHRRIRVRFGVVAGYEERIRRLESALAEELAVAARLARDAARKGAVSGAPAPDATPIAEDKPRPAPVVPPRR